ncbi:MAG: Na/Pi cotransporter family protein [Christensenellales bacterium]
MNALDILESVLMMLGGLGVFLIGIKAMGDNLEAVAGNSLKSIFNKISNNRFTGVAVGAGVTAIIQSSSATTVMVVGFVNAGVMTLTQATSIIMGANIGTTITAQIVSLQSLPITAFFAAMACVGAFMQMSKKLHVRNVGSIIAGVGVLFVGLDVMSSAMKSIAEIDAVRNVLNATTNPLLLLLLGALITALIQSSSVTTSIIISMGISGLINLESAIFTTLGINIGTCITAVLACIGSTVNAKRTSVIHLLFNCIGSFFFFVVFLILRKFTNFFDWMSGTFNGSIANQIAMFHTAFNVITTLLLLPFVKVLPKLAILIVPDKKSEADEQKDIIETEKFQYIDNRLLSTPSIALVMIRKEILAMAGLAKDNLDLSINAVKNKDLSQKALFDTREKRIDFLNKAITKYTIKVSSEHISYISEKESASYYYVVSNIERVGDYAQNIMEYTQELIDYNAEFSDTAKKEIDDMKLAIDKLFEAVVVAFEKQDISQEESIKDMEEAVDDYKAQLERSHLIRLGNGQCSAESAGVFLSLVSNMERIADHILNVFKSMKQYTQVSKTTHVISAPKA